MEASGPPTRAARLFESGGLLGSGRWQPRQPPRWITGLEPRPGRLLLGGCLLLASCLWLGGCTQGRTGAAASPRHRVLQTVQTPELPGQELAQFESVFWEPQDTVSLRQMIVEEESAHGREVLEIGSGTGLLSLLCLQAGAARVVATDINPAAVANTEYNAAQLGWDDRLEARLVPAARPGAFEAIEAGERFDLIISNPPWEDGSIAAPADHALYDPSFALMDSLLDGLPQHLKPGGRCLLAYGHVPAIERLLAQARQRGYQVKVLDPRPLETLRRDFLPGMLIELRRGRDSAPPTSTVDASNASPG